jgi:hypothetical protein
MCRFFDDKDSEKFLAKIRDKNKQEGMGAIVIPGTKIELINYSVCPQCKNIFSYQDLMNYYLNPVFDKHFANQIEQYRTDTRVCCPKCKAWFLPALLIVDGTPKNETQFLCRVQTVHAIEAYLEGKNIIALTRDKNALIKSDKKRAIINKVLLSDLEEKPTLITNMLQYTPPALIPHLLDGSNDEKKDLLFGQWFDFIQWNRWFE